MNLNKLKSVGAKLNSVTRNVYQKAMTDNHSQNYDRVGNQLIKKAHRAKSDKYLGK